MSSGLEAWTYEENDIIVIAGLGAKEILQIFSDKLEQIRKEQTQSLFNKDFKIIIQAMRNQENIRSFFRDNNFTMLEQELVHDNKFYYSVDLYEMNFSRVNAQQ